MGNTENKNQDTMQIKKAFDLEMDFEKLGIEIDRLQRTRLSKEELDKIVYLNDAEIPASALHLCRAPFYNFQSDIRQVPAPLSSFRRRLPQSRPG